MERQFAYSGAIPLDTDLLSTNKDAYIGLAKISAAVLGLDTLLNGFTCTQTAPASLQVSVSAGEIYSLQEIDPTAYGDLPIDNHLILKQGIILDPTLLTIAIPGTVGYSQNYLIQFAFNQTDGDNVVLAYYNPVDPTNPYSGPNNTGASNATVRLNNILISAKAGIAAPTGTQTTPSPDAGYVGGFVVTVVNGQTTITAGNISTYASAPFISETLLQKISQATADIRYAQKTQIQTSQFIYGVDNSVSANTLTVALSPIITGYTGGQHVLVKVANTNTGASTINLNGAGAISIKRMDGTDLLGGDLVAGMIAEMTYDGTNFQLQTPASVNGRLLAFKAFTASGTWTPSAGCSQAFIIAVGGGGGGMGSGPGTHNGSNGGTTTVGAICSATGGTGGNVSLGSTGGTGSGGDLNLSGGDGFTSGGVSIGAAGGSTIFGGCGAATFGAFPGNSAKPNSGAGGAGGPLIGGGSPAGAGGAAGGVAYKLATGLSSASPIAITIGAGGPGGTGGNSNGGVGADGVVLVWEYS